MAGSNQTAISEKHWDVRFGSLADLMGQFSLMTGIGGIADIGTREMLTGWPTALSLTFPDSGPAHLQISIEAKIPFLIRLH